MSRTLVDAAAALVQRVLRFERPADAVAAEYFREHKGLGARDRRVLADTLYAVLRRLALWRHLAEAGRGEPSRRLVLLAWQGDAAQRDASLDDAECDWLAASFGVDRAALPAPLRHNLPDWIAAPLQHALGDGFDAWVASSEAPAPLDLRVNALKADRATVLRELAAAGIEAAPTPYSPLGVRVVGKPALERLPVLSEGRAEVQDEGSQLLALVVGARRNELVVDFCAGAGGKTLALGAQMRGTGRLYAFDVSGHRLAGLPPRLERSGLGNVYAAQIGDQNRESDERVDRLAGKIDRVLVDAPCTGLGTLRRHPDLKWRLSAEALTALGKQQRAILAAASRLVKPGGRLVYATCSPLVAENDDVAADFDAAFGASDGANGGADDRARTGFEREPVLPALERAKVVDAPALVSGADLRLWTHRHGTDGFYAASWRRR